MYFHNCFLKYACTLDILICQFVHMEFSDSTLLIILKLLKNNFFNELDLTSIEFSVIKWFFKSLEELPSENSIWTNWWIKTSSI